jgi:dTDP-4-amino-4,6-dideoxygalactose transaminase
MISSVPFLDLRAQAASLADELDLAVREVIRSGHYVLGEAVEAFEQSFATACGASHAVAVNTGTSALHLALLAAGIGPGDEVITVPMTFVATVAAILYAGATPRFVDIDPETGTLDPRALAAAVTPRTKAVMPVHLHGRLADMTAINTIAAQHGLTVIEDAAQAHLAHQDGRPAGSLGHVGCFSFYPGKNLGACGEGGALVTNDPLIARRARTLRDWGQEEKYVHVMKGFNFRMDAIQGAVLGVKLRHLEAWTAARRRIATSYDRQLGGLDLQLPARAAEGEHVHHVYAIRVDKRDLVRQRLAETGITTGIHYPIPVHLQPAYADLGYGRGDFPQTEAFAATTLSLPIFAELTSSQVDQVCDSLGTILSGATRRVA